MKKFLIGGSPCTHWSIAQSKNRETSAEGIGWELFRNYLIAKEKFKPDFFLYENNKSAAQAIKDQIAAEVEALAKLIYGEAGIVPSTTEQAAVVWCVLNRVDDPRFPDTVLEVIEAPYQFSGYDPEYPVKEEFALLAADVLARYRAERDGEENVGRVLPAEYCFFTGDGRRNHFTTEWKSTDCFGWTLESPYID